MKSPTLRAVAIAAATLIGGTTAYAASTQKEDAKVTSLPHAAPMPEQPAGKWVSWTDAKNETSTTCSMDGEIMAETTHNRTLVIVMQNDGSLPQIKFGGMSWKQIDELMKQKDNYEHDLFTVIDTCVYLTQQVKGKPVGQYQSSEGLLDVTDQQAFPVDFPLPPNGQTTASQIKSNLEHMNAPSP